MIALLGRILAGCRDAVAALMTGPGLKAWALALMAGSLMAMTAYAGAALWFVRTHPGYAFALGLSAHFIILVGVTAYAAMHVQRDIDLNLGGGRRLRIRDQAAAPPDVVAAAATAAAIEMPADPEAGERT